LLRGAEMATAVHKHRGQRPWWPRPLRLGNWKERDLAP